MPILPLPSPPFHQTSLPLPPVPAGIVADGQVLDGDPAGLVDLDAVPAGAAVGVLQRRAGRAGLAGGPVAAVDDDLVAVQAADVQVRRLDPDAGRGPLRALLVVDARLDQNPVTGTGRVDRGLDGLVVGPRALRYRRARRGAAVADEQHLVPACRRRRAPPSDDHVRRACREGLAPGDRRRTGDRQRAGRTDQPPPSHHGSPVSHSPTLRSPDISAMTGQNASNRRLRARQSRGRAAAPRAGSSSGSASRSPGSPGPSVPAGKPARSAAGRQRAGPDSDSVRVFSACLPGNGMPVRSLFAMHHI